VDITELQMLKFISILLEAQTDTTLHLHILLTISSQSPSSTISRTRPNSRQLTHSNDFLCPFITSRLGPRRKYSLFIVQKACLVIRCLAVDVLLLPAYASAGMCLPNRFLAMDLYVKIVLDILPSIIGNNENY
jgi:hypothetical protein